MFWVNLRYFHVNFIITYYVQGYCNQLVLLWGFFLNDRFQQIYHQLERDFLTDTIHANSERLSSKKSFPLVIMAL